MATRLAGFFSDEDPTRPMTAAMNSPTRALDTGFAKPLQLFGVNYNLGVYETVKTMKAYASETSSNYSSRDEYNLVLKDGVPTIEKQLNNHCTSYDLDFPRWGNTAEVQFQAFRKAPWMGGEFVWTGLDYIGEPTPFSWPNRSSSFGIVDLAGFPKDRYYLYQSQWRAEPMVHILPHWNWPSEYRGKTIPVWAYTNADSVELFLNGKSLGSRSWTRRQRDPSDVAGPRTNRARCGRWPPRAARSSPRITLRPRMLPRALNSCPIGTPSAPMDRISRS